MSYLRGIRESLIQTWHEAQNPNFHLQVIPNTNAAGRAFEAGRRPGPRCGWCLSVHFNTTTTAATYGSATPVGGPGQATMYVS